MYDQGFTIVELLIVIVIIAILAAITVVAYNGIQGRANDSIIQADLSNNSKQIEFYKIDNGQHPLNGPDLANVNIQATRPSYDTSYYNLYYCTQTSTRDKYAFAARSKSGTVYYVSSVGKGTLGNTDINGTKACNIIGLTSGTDTTISTGLTNTGVWQSWVD